MSTFRVTHLVQTAFDWQAGEVTRRHYERREESVGNISDALPLFATVAERAGLEPAFRDLRNHPDFVAFMRFEKNRLTAGDIEDSTMFVSLERVA